MYVRPPGSLVHYLVLSWKLIQRARAGLTIYVHREYSSTDQRSTFIMSVEERFGWTHIVKPAYVRQFSFKLSTMFFTEPGSTCEMCGLTTTTLTIPLAVSGLVANALLDSSSTAAKFSFNTLKQLDRDWWVCRWNNASYSKWHTFQAIGRLSYGLLF